MKKEIDYTTRKMSIYNWMMNPEVPDFTAKKAKELIDTGKIDPKKLKTQLISYDQLMNWGMI
jgi:uncharacterized membrane protein YcaP (DUF421 family)